MGTRSLTFVHANTEEDGNSKPVVCIYQQYDGYFSGVGEDILSFLKGSSVVNGIGGGDTTRMFNGSGDLAARIITHFKRGDADSAGGVYIESPDLNDGDMGTEFAYHIYPTVGKTPRIVAVDIYADFEIEGTADSLVWPDQDDDGNYIVAAPVAAPEVDNSGLFSEDQRRALFALFGDVFGGSDQPQRIAFTAMVLGKNPQTDAISWSRYKPGALTANEASRVLDALDALNV